MRVPLRQSARTAHSELEGNLSVCSFSAEHSRLFLGVSPQVMVQQHPGEPEGCCQILVSWQHVGRGFRMLWEAAEQANVGLKL